MKGEAIKALVEVANVGLGVEQRELSLRSVGKYLVARYADPFRSCQRAVEVTDQPSLACTLSADKLFEIGRLLSDEVKVWQSPGALLKIRNSAGTYSIKLTGPAADLEPFTPPSQVITTSGLLNEMQVADKFAASTMMRPFLAGICLRALHGSQTLEVESSDHRGRAFRSSVSCFAGIDLHAMVGFDFLAALRLMPEPVQIAQAGRHVLLFGDRSVFHGLSFDPVWRDWWTDQELGPLERLEAEAADVRFIVKAARVCEAGNDIQLLEHSEGTALSTLNGWEGSACCYVSGSVSKPYSFDLDDLRIATQLGRRLVFYLSEPGLPALVKSGKRECLIPTRAL